MSSFIDALIETNQTKKAEYARKYGVSELANGLFIPEQFTSSEQFYDYCLETGQRAKDVATDIYE